MPYQLAQIALQKAKALVRAQKFTDKPWSFAADDSNALLGTPPNWTEYQNWFLGHKEGTPDPAADTGVVPVKENYAYPFGRDGLVYSEALKAIASQAKAAGDSAIADAATAMLAEIASLQKDRVTAAADPNDKDGLFFLGVAHITAGDAGVDGAPKIPTFDMDAYTGGPMQLKGWKYPVVVDLDGVDATSNPRPILRDHDATKPLGHTTDVSPQGGILKAKGVISATGEHVDDTVNAAKNGFPWQASIGAKVLQNEFVPDGKSASANGRDWPGPINIARRTSLREISVLALGADDDTSARIAASAAKGSKMKKKFAAWARAAGLKCDDMDAEAMKAAKATFKAAMKADADDENDEDDDGKDEPSDDDKKKKDADAKAASKQLEIEAAADKTTIAAGAVDAKKIASDINTEIRASAKKERQRIAAVTAKLDEYRPRIDAKKFADIEAKALDGDYDLDKTELELMRIARSPGKTVNAPFINSGAGSEPTADIIASACAIAGGVGEKAALSGLTDQQKNVVMSRDVRKYAGSIYGLCSIIASSHGVTLGSPRMDPEVLNLMDRVERRIQNMDIQADASGGYSTMSLSGITENILNKAMLESYGNVDSVVDEIAYQTDTPDFKQFKRYRMTASGILAALGAAGELKSITLQDESYANQVQTQGVILTIGRPILLNDDMGALTQAPTLLGRGAALFREMTMFQTILNLPTTAAPGASVNQTANNFNFFSTGAGNYQSGAGSVLGINSVTTAVQQFWEQTDANNMPIMVKPTKLLVPPALQVAADALFNGANVVVGQLAQVAATGGTKASQSTVVTPDVNQHKGRYKPVVSPFLSAAVSAKIRKSGPAMASYPTASNTAWTLLPEPSGGFAIVQIGYLRGQRTPVIERGEANFNTLGIAMRCYFDFGVAAHDFRCGQYSAGA